MAVASAAASAAEPFSIRGFAARMRAVDTAKCWPFGGGGELEPDPQLPPMDPPPRSRWWAHELAAERARLAVGGPAEGGGKGGGLGKGTKRKGSRGSGEAERAKKRRRALQFIFFLKHKEKTTKPQSTSRLLQHVLHKGLLRKRKNPTIHTWRELAVRKKLQEQETQDHMSTHESSLNKQRRRGMDPCNDMNSSLFRRKAANSFVNKRSMKVSRSTNYPLNPGCEVVKHVAYPPKDDIFGDLPLLESSKIMFQTGVDEIPTVIEDSFVTNQSGPDAISETVPLKLMPASDITVQTSSPLEDLVKKEGNPGKESTCISLNDAGRSHPSSAGFDGPLNHSSINMVKTCLGDIQLKSTDVPALSSYSNEGPKSGSCNPPQGYFYTNTNCCQEIKKPGTSSATSSAAVRTRAEATKKDRDAAVNGKKNTDISGPLVPTEYHLSSEGSVLSSVISQGTVNTGTNTDSMSSSRSMPAREYVPTSSPFGNFASNICHENRKSMDTCTPLSMEDQGNWYSKLCPVCTPASIGLAFMKLPGLERMEISSCNLRTCENTFMNGRSMNTVRCQKQQLVSGVTNNMQGQKKIGFSDSQARKKGPDGYARQDVYHSHQPTVRLMGKTVSVCKRSKEQKVSTMGTVWTDNSIIKEDHLSSISCQLPQKRLFPCQDSVIPRAHVNEFTDILPRIPNSALSETRSTITDVQNQRLQRINSVSSTVKDRTWNSGSQFVCQTEVNKASMISSDSRSRHLDLHQPPQVISIPQNQHSPLCTPASSMYREDHNFVGPAVNQSSSFPQWVINTSMQGKYQKSTLLSYNDPSSVPIRQPCQVPGAKLSSTSIISFHDYGTNNAEYRNSYQGVRPSLTTSLASNSISTTGPTCIGILPNIDVRKGAAFVNQRNKRPAYADIVSQQPAKRQLVTDKQDLTTPMVPNMKNHSLGWSLNDAVGPRMLDFSNKIAGHATQISRNENNNLRVSSGPVQVVETRSRALRLVAGATKTPGQNLNDHSKLLYSTKFSFDNGINSVVL